jgi:hypothetical protein
MILKINFRENYFRFMQFFRKFRQKLLTKSKFSKYLLYAIGEIVLVVIGILIALAINNQNQEQTTREKEQTYLTGLKEEFETSKAKLTELISVNRNNYSGAKQIITFLGNEEPPSEKRFSELMYNTFSFDISFNPNNSLLNEMIYSGSLKDIRDIELRRRLTNWFSTLEDISKQENELGIQREKVLDIFRKNESSLRTIFYHAGIDRELGLPEKKAHVSNLGLLNSAEFENNILMFMVTSHAAEEAHYRPLMQQIDAILLLINKEITGED